MPRSDEDYRELVELLDRVTARVGENENHPLASLMDVLGVLIEKYEDEHVSELTEQVPSRYTVEIFPSESAHFITERRFNSGT